MPWRPPTIVFLLQYITVFNGHTLYFRGGHNQLFCRVWGGYGLTARVVKGLNEKTRVLGYDYDRRFTFT